MIEAKQFCFDNRRIGGSGIVHFAYRIRREATKPQTVYSLYQRAKWFCAEYAERPHIVAMGAPGEVVAYFESAEDALLAELAL